MTFTAVCILFFISGFGFMCVLLAALSSASHYDDETERMYRRDRVDSALKEARGE